MYNNGDEVVIILDNKIRIGQIYDFKDGEYRVADGELEEGKFSFSAWVEEDFIAPKLELLNTNYDTMNILVV